MALSRKSPMKRRRARPAEDRVDPLDAIYVIQRDGGCVAAQTDPTHLCQGRITVEHVPERGENALGVRAKSNRRHMIALCLGAQGAYWGEMHREVERDWLDEKEPAA